MKYLLGSAAMKEADRHTIEDKGIPSLDLMENAARAAAEEIALRYTGKGRILVVCGSGNNGGDGLAVARLLHRQHYRTEAAFVGNPDKATAETKAQLSKCKDAGVDIYDTIRRNTYDVVVDAVFGIGLCRNVEGRYAEIINKMNSIRALKFAIDISSGISADTGDVLGTAFMADYTVTFAYGKIGQFRNPGSGYCGRVIIKDIGIHGTKEAELSYIRTFRHKDIARLLPKRSPYSNKGTFGKALIIAGSRNMAGAAYMSALAAYRMGAGLVRVYTAQENRVILQTLLPEAILTTYESGNSNAGITSSCIEWADFIAAGPGLGMSPESESIIAQLMSQAPCPLVIDADGLNILGRHPEWLENRVSGKVIITPHPGEMARIARLSVSDVLDSFIKTADDFALMHNVICVLKDSSTYVASPGRSGYLNLSGSSSMAKAGSGDVLTGIILGLLCNGMEPCDAAELGVYIHGLCGEETASVLGEYSPLGRELADAVSEVLRKYR